MYIDKRRLSVAIPMKLYERLESDFQNYGIAKTYTVVSALMSYYASIDRQLPARYPGVCQGTRTGDSPSDTP